MFSLTSDTLEPFDPKMKETLHQLRRQRLPCYHQGIMEKNKDQLTVGTLKSLKDFYFP